MAVSWAEVLSVLSVVALAHNNMYFVSFIEY